MSNKAKSAELNTKHLNEGFPSSCVGLLQRNRDCLEQMIQFQT